MQLNFIKYAPIIEKARTSFWFVPSIMVFFSMLLALCSIYIDAWYISGTEFSVPVIYGTDIEAIRSLLGTIAGAMITVTSIAFSSTIVALTLASSQFGPRLIRNFMMDTGTQIVLGSFISNFLFCILVFCAISFDKPYAFQPGLTIIIAIVMTCLSVGILIYFIHHVAKSIQADVVIDDVYQELQRSIENLFPSEDEQEKSKFMPLTNVPKFRDSIYHKNVLAIHSGYAETIDHDELTTLARRNDAVIECKIAAGRFVVRGTILAVVYSDKSLKSDISDDVRQYIGLGAYRTPVQDPEFAVHQLVEIALRALSPGINDPYTAVTCIDKINSVLCGLTKRQFPYKYHFDEDGTLRIVCKALVFNNVATAAVNQIRQQACNNVAVTIRLLESLQTLATFAQTNEQEHFILSQTKMIEEQQIKQPNAQQDAQDIANIITSIYGSFKQSQQSPLSP